MVSEDLTTGDVTWRFAQTPEEGPAQAALSHCPRHRAAAQASRPGVGGWGVLSRSLGGCLGQRGGACPCDCFPSEATASVRLVFKVAPEDGGSRNPLIDFNLQDVSGDREPGHQGCQSRWLSYPRPHLGAQQAGSTCVQDQWLFSPESVWASWRRGGKDLGPEGGAPWGWPVGHPTTLVWGVCGAHTSPHYP